jgi:hypothetical protein
MTNDVTKVPGRPAWATELNDQEWLFVAAYLDSLNAKQAARAAGLVQNGLISTLTGGKRICMVGRSIARARSHICHGCFPIRRSDRVATTPFARSFKGETNHEKG